MALQNDLKITLIGTVAKTYRLLLSIIIIRSVEEIETR